MMRANSPCRLRQRSASCSRSATCRHRMGQVRTTITLETQLACHKTLGRCPLHMIPAERCSCGKVRKVRRVEGQKERHGS